MYFNLNAPAPAFQPPVSFVQRVDQACQSIELGNNGWADIGTSAQVAEAVTARGYIVIRAQDAHGRWVFRGFTQRAQRALAGSPEGVSTYKAPATRLELPDCEPAILARNDRHLLG